MQLRGVKSFFSNRFDITKHKQYRLLSDYDEKNAFDIEKYVKNLCKAKVRDNDTIDEVEDAGVGVWGVINLLEGYGNDNPGAKAHVR